MSKLQAIHSYFRTLGSPSVDRAMAAALPTADPAAMRLIARTLLQRSSPVGMIGLVQAFHRLEPDLQIAVISEISELYRPLREASTHHDSRVRLNVIRIVQRARCARLAYLVSEQFRHGAPEIHPQAAKCLQVLAKSASSYAVAGGEPRMETARAQFLQASIAEAVVAYAHHSQSRVLTALCELGPCTVPQANATLGQQHPATKAMRKLLEAANEPAIRRALLVYLPLHTLTGAALGGIRRVGREQAIADLLDTAHLTVNPKVAKRLTKLVQTGGLVPATDKLNDLTSQQSRGLVHWLMSLPFTSEQQVDYLARMVRCADVGARLAVLRQIMALADGGEADDANRAIAGFCHDANAGIARIAFRHLIGASWGELTRLMFQLVNSRHPSVRQIAMRQLAPLAFRRLWSSWSELSFAQQLEAGRALIKLDADFHHKLTAKLAPGHRDDQLRAIAIVRGLNQGELFDQTLLALADGEDQTVASAALRALGSAPSAHAEAILHRALEHADSRVRANAVEALHQLQSTRHVKQLLEMARHDDNRPRANAIGALMQMHTGDALSALANMLVDPRPDHRTSALWMVDHMGLIEVARHVAELSISDGDENVRKRAGEVIQHLIQSLDQPDEASRAPEETQILTTS